MSSEPRKWSGYYRWRASRGSKEWSGYYRWRTSRGSKVAHLIDPHGSVALCGQSARMDATLASPSDPTCSQCTRNLIRKRRSDDQ